MPWGKLGRGGRLENTRTSRCLRVPPVDSMGSLPASRVTPRVALCSHIAAIQLDVEAAGGSCARAPRLAGGEEPRRSLPPFWLAVTITSTSTFRVLLWWARSREEVAPTDPELVLGVFLTARPGSPPIVNSVISLSGSWRPIRGRGDRRHDPELPRRAAGPRTRPGPRQVPDGGFRVNLRGGPLSREPPPRAGRCPREI